MANEADLLAAATALRHAESVAGFTAYQLRSMWGADLGMWGGTITPAVHEGVGNSLANSELLRAELADRAADCDRAAATARAYKAAMDRYRTDLETWTRKEAAEPDEDHGRRPRHPGNGSYGPTGGSGGQWPSWVSE